MEKNQNEQKTSKKKVVVKKPKIPTEKYTLEQDVEVCGKDGVVTFKKGTKIPLTKEGATYFKSKSYIK
jgi:hypothetical protein